MKNRRKKKTNEKKNPKLEPQMCYKLFNYGFSTLKHIYTHTRLAHIVHLLTIFRICYGYIFSGSPQITSKLRLRKHKNRNHKKKKEFFFNTFVIFVVVVDPVPSERVKYCETVWKSMIFLLSELVNEKRRETKNECEMFIKK